MEYVLMVIVGFLLGMYIQSRPGSNLTIKQALDKRRKNKIVKLQRKINSET